jgi:hypothetical protein
MPSPALIRCALLTTVSALALATTASARVALGDRGFTLTTPRLEVTIEDGLIVGLKDLASGEVHAERSLGETNVPAGLGHLTGDPKAMERLHCPWGNQQMNQDLPPGQAYPTMHRPGPKSRYQAERIRGGVRATWTGLTNGTKDFPEETFTLEATVDARSGQLLLRAVGASPEGGVYGLQAPIVNLHPDHAFYVASFGGVRYDNRGRPGLITLGGTPFWEAPAVAIEGRQSSLGLWVEDEGFPTTFYFMNWTGKSFSAAIESINRMPFEPLTSATSCTWHVDSLPGGWVDALTPYKKWYATTFAAELAQRAAVTWADRIRVIVDHSSYSDEVLRLLATTFEPDTVLFHEWSARAAEFDHELPDWTPRAGYAERVKRLHAYGFHTMAYVNTYCINYNSSVFQRDRIAEFALPRKISGIAGYASPPASFAGAKDGQLFYLDPLAPRWRTYHTDMMLQWRRDTATDANYEDVGGTAGDFGNGVIDGRSGAQGGTEQFRELLRRNPEVPMASEYAPDHMAFAVRWPLRYQQVWGNEATRVWWMEHQRPVSAYIHGPLARPWVPVINAESDFGRHVVVACSDALGGLGQLFGTEAELNATTGMPYHMKLRAQFFAARQLQPVFPPRRWDAALACVYQDRDGQVYHYSATPTLQQLTTGPDSQPVYQRLTGLNQLATPLTLPGWPAASAGRIMGLNPAVRYALNRGAHDRTSIQVTALPEGIRITRFDVTKQRTLLVLEPVAAQAPRQGAVTLQANAGFTRTLLNDQTVDGPPWDEKAKASAGPKTYETAFPAHFVFTAVAGTTVPVDTYIGHDRETGCYLSVATGLERGGEAIIQHRANLAVPGEATPPPCFLLDWGSDCEVTLDWLVTVPAADSALRVYVRNSQTKYGNGAIARLYLNGRVVHAFDLGPQPNPAWKEGDDPYARNLWDTAFHAWTVPVGQFAGQPLAITLATDAKGENNADMTWWSRPKFIRATAPEPTFTRLNDKGEAGAE